MYISRDYVTETNARPNSFSVSLKVYVQASNRKQGIIQGIHVAIERVAI